MVCFGQQMSTSTFHGQPPPVNFYRIVKAIKDNPQEAANNVSRE